MKKSFFVLWLCAGMLCWSASSHAADSQAGFYIGNGGVSDSDDYTNGSFAVFVGTNQQLTVIGYDDGNGTDNGQDFGFYLQTNLDDGGDFIYNASYVSAIGNIYGEGHFYAGLEYTNGETVTLQGSERSLVGPFQFSAGYYSGTFSEGTNSGAFNAILAPNGQIFYVPINSTSQGSGYGNPGNGGSGLFGSSTGFTNTSVTGTTVKGTLNPKTFVITGTVEETNGAKGTYNASRQAYIPIDIPTVSITSPTSGLLWSNAMFTVTGKAGDSLGVSNVYYSLNEEAYASAITTNGWTNWSKAVTLSPGTNFISAYAINTNGFSSTTDTVKLVYIVSAQLTVETNGVGIISPNYNNALLQIDKEYKITVKAGKGFTFVNWSGGTSLPLAVLTNKPALTFTMKSNLVLQANLKYTEKPFLSITNVKIGMIVSNAAFTVMGRATDNVAVASVNYSLNRAAYVPAITNGARWSAAVTLAPGTNIFSVYAEDTSSNFSETDTVKMIYLAYAPLTVETNGEGIISPNDNHVLLQVGKNYTIKAKAINGFTFINWSGGTALPLAVLTNKPALTFAMGSNLVLQANLKDLEKPYLSVTDVKTGLVVSNAAFTVMGRATDNVAVASVNYSFNGSVYAPVTLNGASWSEGVMLSPGTNTFAVYAVDTSSNISATNLVIILRKPMMSTFLVVSNNEITHPQAQISFDGTNYLVVYQAQSAHGTAAVGQFVSSSGELIGGPLSLNPEGSDDPPYLDFDGQNYLVAWADYSDQAAGVPVRGVFVTPAGVVGPVVALSQSTNVDSFSTVVYGGGVYFLMWSDNRTSPDSIYGAIINSLGANVSGDFLIATNGNEDEAAGISAAYDGTNFLAVWYSASGNTSINARLIDTAGASLGQEINLYTNSTPAGTGLPSVTFDGTKYLVLFNTGVNPTNSPGSFHVLGRFVTTSGAVLTNQVTLTSDAGPQGVASADFDGVNYLVSWNQGLNPFEKDTSTTIYGRFFDSEGNPTTAEFPVFTTQSGAEIPVWAPVLWDGSKFVLVGGRGKMLNPSPDMDFTNGVIDGAFISP